ncbi:MAG: TIGR03643 family protein, partial [Longimonas sp.]|uniref:TIGR03643 family protein n=1 Tax=Longimonas sp. TaxID=2039626 RepID=UPI003974F406
MADLFQNYIDGTWQAAATGQTFASRNPASFQDVVGHFPASGPADVDDAADAAQRAFDSWSSTPAPERGRILKRIGDLLLERKDDLADAMTREMGKPLSETRGDVQEAIDTAYYAASELEDRTPFDAIFHQFGIPEKAVIKLMRREMKESAFKRWRKRVQNRST